jgi:hypothetical protein
VPRPDSPIGERVRNGSKPAPSGGQFTPVPTPTTDVGHAIARNAAEAPRRRISLDANPAGGARAIIALPVFRPAADTAATAAENVPS